MSVELVILVDNVAGSEALQTEHGLAVLISGPGKKLLFDAAASAEVLLQNARSLGVDLGEIDASIISHGHNDHTGGLGAVAGQRRGLGIYAHPSAFLRRWAGSPGQPLKDVSCPHSLPKLRQFGAVFRPIKGPEMLTEWLVLSGPVGGSRHGTEAFVIRKDDNMIVDRFEDELFCLLRGEQGWTVLTGCCHRGLKNILRAARFLTRGQPITAIVGGLHLRNAHTQELHETVELLKGFGPPEIYPCHCTGPKAIDFLTQNLPEQVRPLKAGSKLTF
jgi:7,8-dihydropterin-6-yl-methyl-4-(beta-D-ribofuranosyl)aminobenzene 5'-phosphate synthase